MIELKAKKHGQLPLRTAELNLVAPETIYIYICMYASYNIDIIYIYIHYIGVLAIQK